MNEHNAINSSFLTTENLRLLHVYNGKRGIVNMGATCFINTVLQSLCHIPELMIFFLSGKCSAHIQILRNSGIQTILLIELFDDFLKELRTTNANKNKFIQADKIVRFSELLSKSLFQQGKFTKPFTQFEMGDSQEFLTFILDRLNEELKIPVEIEISEKSKNQHQTKYSMFHIQSLNVFKMTFEKNYSIIVDLFYGQFGMQIYQQNTFLYHRMIFDPFSSLSLQFPNENKQSFLLTEMMDYYFQEEDPEIPLKDDNGNIQLNMKRRTCLWKLPKVLIIDIKRYNYPSTKKDTRNVIYTEDLDLRAYYRNGFIQTNNKNHKNTFYRLICCINHISNSQTYGHYFCDCKDIKCQWTRYDDTTVSNLSFTDVLQNTSQSIYQLIYFQLYPSNDE